MSHETIYQAIYLQARGSLRAELTRQVALRSGRARRRPSPGRPPRPGRASRPWIGDLHISTRPAEAADRAVPGHWEGDLLIGARGASAIVTLVERATRYVMLVALPDARVSDARHRRPDRLARRLPAALRRSLTWDQGTEMARHAHVHHRHRLPGLLLRPALTLAARQQREHQRPAPPVLPQRQHRLPHHTQADLDTVAHELNGRPRQTLNWHNPSPNPQPRANPRPEPA